MAIMSLGSLKTFSLTFLGMVLPELIFAGCNLASVSLIILSAVCNSVFIRLFRLYVSIVVANMSSVCCGLFPVMVFSWICSLIYVVLVLLEICVGMLGSSLSSVICCATGFLDTTRIPRFEVLCFFAGVLTVIPELLNGVRTSSSVCICSLHTSLFISICQPSPKKSHHCSTWDRPPH